MSQKRASRAGTRSVTTLSAAQLERKRANDREAQRAIRQRTKDHIEALERRINELSMSHDNREKTFVATQQRNQELEEENAYLRSRLGGETFTINVTEAERKGKPTDYGVSTSGSSPQPNIPRSSPSGTSRSMPIAPLHHSQPSDSWRNHGTFTHAGSTGSTQFLTDSAQAGNGTQNASWRANDAADSPQNRIDQGSEKSRGFPVVHGVTDRTPWANSTSGYGYQVRPADRAPTYTPAPPQALSFPPQTQPPHFQSVSAPTNELPPTTSAYHAPGLVPQSDYQPLSTYPATQQTTFHDQSQAHPAYQIGPGQVQPPSDFSSSGIQRGNLAAPVYTTSAGSPHFLQTQPTHAQSLAISYRDGAGHHPYSYET
ncbi:hypothetical protein AAFC00_000107 [Neodothiora populina]